MSSSEKHVPPAQNGPEALTGTRDSVFSRAVQEIMTLERQRKSQRSAYWVNALEMAQVNRWPITSMRESFM